MTTGFDEYWREIVQAGKTKRFLVFRTANSRNYLCICAARDQAHALKIAAQQFRLDSTAYALEE